LRVRAGSDFSKLGPGNRSHRRVLAADLVLRGRLSAAVHKKCEGTHPQRILNEPSPCMTAPDRRSSRPWLSIVAVRMELLFPR
jgi:hypothetical protein